MAGKLSRRAYTDQDLPILQTMGVASAFLAALVLSLYLQSQAAHSLYTHPAWLLAVAVAVLFWLSRVWMQTARGEMHDDPVVWALEFCDELLLRFVAARSTQDAEAVLGVPADVTPPPRRDAPA